MSQKGDRPLLRRPVKSREAIKQREQTPVSVIWGLSVKGLLALVEMIYQAAGRGSAER